MSSKMFTPSARATSPSPAETIERVEALLIQSQRGLRYWEGEFSHLQKRVAHEQEDLKSANDQVEHARTHVRSLETQLKQLREISA